jgi:DNA modification methylase
VLADADLTAIAGHGRVLAARDLGLPEVPVIKVEHLSPAQIKAYRIADNRLNECSEWDEKLLSEQLKELSLVDLDFELEVIGFDMGEIDLRIQGLNDDAHDQEDDPVDAIPVCEGPPVSRPGDLWLLGSNRVYCASALDPAAYKTVMQGRKAQMVFADPPYNVPIAGNVSGLGEIQHRDFAMGAGEMTRAQFTSFLNTVCSLLARVSVGGSLHYICMDWRHMGELLAATGEVYTDLKNLCVWTKNHTGMGALYRSRHELIFVFKNGHEAHRNNVELGRHGRDRTNVWNYPSPRTPSEEGNLLAMHPTVKPAAMVADAIMDCTARGEILE